MNKPIRIPLGTLLKYGIPIAIAIIAAIYLVVTDNKQGHIDELETRIQGKNDLLDEYRERLHLTSESSTAFSTMSNKELSAKALEVVSSVRDYIEKEKNENTRFSSLQRQEMRSAKTDAERQQVWSKGTDRLFQNSSKQLLYYFRNFQTDTILLRDEILTRLPKGSKDKIVDIFYETPANQLAMIGAVNDLERIAKSLP